MDADRFDRLTQVLSRTTSRRGAVTGGMAGLLAGAAAGDDAAARRRKRKARSKRRRNRQRTNEGQDRVGAEAICTNPGPSSNLKGCNFRNQDLPGIDLSSSNLRGADFRGAILCGADLSSSNLRQVRFQNADLTLADLSSSGCRGVRFNAGTTFCRTIMCDGNVNNTGCPPDGTEPVCCPVGEANCGAGCVDIENDWEHCGECGRACAVGERCAGGACAAGCTVCESGCQFSSVQEASDDPSLATIRICPGAYHENLSIERSVTLIGAGSGENGTVLRDGGIPLSVVFVAPSITVELRDLAIAGGNTVFGGGITNNGTLTLTGCVVRDNTTTAEGGGIWNEGALTLEAGSSVTSNHAGSDGGGIYNVFDSTVILEAGSAVTGNHAGSDGGGIYNEGGMVTVTDTSIVMGNTIGSMDDPNNCDGSPPVPHCVNP